MAFEKSCNDDTRAQIDVWKHAFGFTGIAAVKAAVVLNIPDILESHVSMSLSELTAMLDCSSSSLHRVMTFLTHYGVFKQVTKSDDQTAYAKTALSRLLTKDNYGYLVLLQSSPQMVAARDHLAEFVMVSKDTDISPFELAHGVDYWRYAEENPSFGELFNVGMASHGRVVISTVIESYPEAFRGISCLVDVAGGNGTTLRTLVNAFPSITRAIHFDQPHVVAASVEDENGVVEHVGGDMFKSVPNADAAFLMSVLHDWDDDDCVKILKNCKKAIPEETGKVIIVDHVVDLESEENPYKFAQLALDMEMMIHMIKGKGKERTAKEWENLLTAAGFSKYTIKQVPLPHCVIEAYP